MNYQRLVKTLRNSPCIILLPLPRETKGLREIASPFILTFLCKTHAHRIKQLANLARMEITEQD